MKKKIIFCGTPKIGEKSLEAIYNKNNIEILFVISQPDKLIGRKKEIIFSPVKKFCIKNNIKIYQPNKIIELKDIIKDSKVDLIVTCAYGQFIPTSILEIPKYRCVNIHASLLPKYRGGAPIHWAIINGEQETGITLMYMEKEMDSGDIIYQKKISIDEDDDLGTLFYKMEELAHHVIFNKIDILFNEKVSTIKQNINEVTFGYNINRQDEKINWNNSAKRIHNLIRGLSPKPGSFTLLDGKIVKIYKSKILNIVSNEKEPGKIIDVNKDGIVVNTNDYNILIKSIQFEGKNIISNNDIYNNKNKLINKVFL